VDAVDEDVATLGKFAQDFGIGMPLCRDPGASYTGKWGITGVPTCFFIDRKGVVQAIRSGEIAEDDLKALVQQILKFGN
jgi:hypothetical protein